jgi:hypothetical protein
LFVIGILGSTILAFTFGLVILAGNMRYLAAKELKYSEAPVFIMRGLTEAQEKAIMILDNVTFGEWDFSALSRDGNSRGCAGEFSRNSGQIVVAFG